MEDRTNAMAFFEKTGESVWHQAAYNVEEKDTEQQFIDTVRQLKKEKYEQEPDMASMGFTGYTMNLLCRRSEIRFVVCDAVYSILNGLGALKSDVKKADWESLLRVGDPEINHRYREKQLEMIRMINPIVKKVDDDCEQAVREAVGEQGDGKYAVVINPYPIRRAMFTCIRSDGPLRVFDGEEELPAQYIGGDGATAVEVEMDGFSIRTLRLEENGTPCKLIPMSPDGYSFQNERMKIHVYPDGSISSFCSLKSGEVLSNQRGNLLEAKLADENGNITTLYGEADGGAHIETGDLFDNVLIKGKLGDSTYQMIMYLPHGTSQRVEIMTDLFMSPTLKQAMQRKGSKIGVVWHTNMKNPELYADGPFECRAVNDKPMIYSANGVSITENGHGLLYDHQGVSRAVYQDGKLINVWAMGGSDIEDETPAGILDARNDSDPSKDSYRYFHAVSLTDSARVGDMFSRILYYQIPMYPLRTKQAFDSRVLFSVDGKEMMFSSATTEQECIYVKMWNASQCEVSLQWHGELQVDYVVGEDGRKMTDHPYAKPSEMVMFVLHGANPMQCTADKREKRL